MAFQHVQQSRSQNPQTSSSASQFSPRTFPTQELKHQPTQEEIENQAFEQDKFDATGLQLKEKYGAITPTERERLAVLQARIDSSQSHRMERPSQFDYNFATIPVHRPGTQVPVPIQPRLATGERWKATLAKTTAVPIQLKPLIGQPNDRYEQEAEQVAQQVMSLTLPSPPGLQPQTERKQEEVQTELTARITPIAQNQTVLEDAKPIQSRDETWEQQQQIQRLSNGKSQTPLDLENRLETSKGKGSALPDEVRSFMEQRFGNDFSQVRVHTDHNAVQMNRALNAQAFTYNHNVYFGAGKVPAKDALTAHELTHVLQQTTRSNVLQRQADSGAVAATPPAATVTGNPQRLEVEVVGADATTDEPLAIMADRWARSNGGRVIRVTSIENMIAQLEQLVAVGTCLGRLNVWYHGGPEIQLVVGEYEFGSERRRLPASGFSRAWLALESNHTLLTHFRQFFCCDALMHWFGCGTATVRAAGGLRTPEEMERDPAHLTAHPDIYSSAEDARRHGATIAGGAFGRVNVQSWANATCTTIRSATNFVRLDPESRTPITIASGGRWTDTPPTSECTCDSATGRVTGEAPSRREIVEDMNRQVAELVGEDNVLWHEYLLSLRTGVLREQMAVPGTIPARLRSEMRNRVADRRGSLEDYFSQLLFSMLRLAGEGITPPAPLPARPMGNHLFVRIRTGGSWAAVTQPHLAVVNRNDFWHWIVFNDAAIGETPEFTRTVIEHELQHAADYENDLATFEAVHPRPTSTPPRRYGYPAEAADVRSWNDEWGQYINDFISFQEGRTRSERHFEIVLGQRRGFGSDARSSWDRWSAQERAYWFELAFTHLPPDVPAGTTIPGEDEVLAAFASADPALQAAAVQRAYDVLHNALYPDPTGDPTAIAQGRAIARTLIQHFEPIMHRVFVERPLLPRPTMLRLLTNREHR